MNETPQKKISSCKCSRKKISHDVFKSILDFLYNYFYNSQVIISNKFLYEDIENYFFDLNELFYIFPYKKIK